MVRERFDSAPDESLRATAVSGQRAKPFFYELKLFSKRVASPQITAGSLKGAIGTNGLEGFDSLPFQIKTKEKVNGNNYRKMRSLRDVR